jgi:predicted nuclease with TOPRIM domain
MPYVGISLCEENSIEEKFNKIEDMVNDIYKVVLEQDIPPSKHFPIASTSTQTVDDESQKLVITVFVNKKREINFRILVDK